ncbi:MAG: alpha/beta hydrolase, partial [Bacillota bacterium]|nr:alpha/beta hydrolase [Bacillota bacterium]
MIIFVHGGNWDSGDKNYRAGGADVYANIGRFYAARGIGVAVINYRPQPVVAWPAQVDDVRAAVTWVRANIS